MMCTHFVASYFYFFYFCFCFSCSSLTLTDGAWHRLTVTARNKISLATDEVTHGPTATRSNPPYTRYYLDGVFVDEIPYAVEAPIYTIGSAYNNNEEWGSLSDVHLYHVALTHREILSLIHVRNPLVKRRLLTMRNQEIFQTMTVHMPSDGVCEPLHPKITLHLLDLEPTVLFVESNGASVGVIQHDVRVVDDYDSGRIGFDSNIVASSRAISEATNFQLEVTRWGGTSGDVITRWWIEGVEHGMGRTARCVEIFSFLFFSFFFSFLFFSLFFDSQCVLTFDGNKIYLFFLSFSGLRRVLMHKLIPRMWTL